MTPAVGLAQAVQTGKDAAASTIGKGRLGGSATFENDVGIGTFVRNDYSDDAYFAQSLRLLPTYGLFKNVTAQADQTIEWEWTSPSDAGAGPSGRHWEIDDMILRLSHSSLYRDERLTGINLSGAFSAALPFSHDSRWRDYITKLTATGSLDRTFLNRLTTYYTLAVTKYVTSTPTRGEADPGTDDDGNRSRLCSENDRCPGVGGTNLNFAFRNTLGLVYRFTDKFSAGMLLRFTTYLKYKIGDKSDPENVDGTANRYRYTYTLGDISGSYAINDRYSVSAGISSEQLSVDQRGTPRFPWFDFETSKENYTTIYVSGTATF